MSRCVVTCTVQDVQTQQKIVKLDLGESLIGWWADKSDNLKAILDKYSIAQTARRANVISYAAVVDPTKFTDGPYKMVDQKAVIILRDDAGKTHKLEIPAPKATMFEEVPEKGYRVTKTAGQDIATQITAMGGIAVTFVRGKLKSKDGKRN